MTDVACFCGCCYSFDGGAGACPRCGECAVVRPAVAALGAEPAGGPAPAGDPEPAASSEPMLGAEQGEEQRWPTARPLAVVLARWLTSAGST
jgi:hypothetical protein